MTTNNEESARLRAVCAVLGRYGEAVAGGAGAESVAYEWLAAGCADPEEVEDWLRARCFRAQHAQALEQAGFTPAQAALRTNAGAGNYEDTIAYKFAQGDLTLSEARRIVTSDFWHS